MWYESGSNVGGAGWSVKPELVPRIYCLPSQVVRSWAVSKVRERVLTCIERRHDVERASRKGFHQNRLLGAGRDENHDRNKKATRNSWKIDVSKHG